MHPNEERPHGFWEVDDPPDPTIAQTGEEFVAELSVLLRWSGLSFREIEHRAMAYCGFLPEGTVSSTLRGGTLPSEELLVPLLWAVGCDDETIGLWVWARGRLAAANAQFDPTEVYWVPDEPTGYSDGDLAQAVQERHGQDGWRGLHRRAFPDSGDAKYTPKRLRSKGSESSPSWPSRIVIGLVGGGLALAAGVAVALSGEDKVASPPAANGDGLVCCLDSPAAGSQTPFASQESMLPSDAPEPSSSTKPVVNPTPRPTVTTQGPPPAPTPTQPKPPQLTGSGNATCARQDGKWLIDVVITATLTGAPSGTDPQGQAGLGGGPVSTFALSGTGGTTFSGQTSIDAGPDSAPVVGSIQWTASVTVPGGGTVDVSGSEGFSCS